MDAQEKNEFKIKFIESIVNNPDIPCINLDSIKDQIFSQNAGRFKKVQEYKNYRIITNVRWNKEKFVFKCSIVVLKKKNLKWKSILRFDDAHGYRHCDFKSTKMPMGTLFKIECPVLSLIIRSLPEDMAKIWKEKLFDEFKAEVAKRK